MPPHYSRRLGKRLRPATPESLVKFAGTFTNKPPAAIEHFKHLRGWDERADRREHDWSFAGAFVQYNLVHVAARIIQRRWARYTKRRENLRSLFGFTNHFDPYDSPG